MDPDDPFALLKAITGGEAGPSTPTQEEDPFALLGRITAPDYTPPAPEIPEPEEGLFSRVIGGIGRSLGINRPEDEIAPMDPMLAAQQPMAVDAGFSQPDPGLSATPEGTALQSEIDAQLAMRQAAEEQAVMEQGQGLVSEQVTEEEAAEIQASLNTRIVELADAAGVSVDDESLIGGLSEGLDLGILTRSPGLFFNRAAQDEELKDALTELGITKPSLLGRVMGSIVGVGVDIVATRRAGAGVFAKIPQLVKAGRMSPRVAAILEGALEGVPSDLLRLALDEEETLGTVGLGTVLGGAAGAIFPGRAIKEAGEFARVATTRRVLQESGPMGIPLERTPSTEIRSPVLDLSAPPDPKILDAPKQPGLLSPPVERVVPDTPATVPTPSVLAEAANARTTIREGQERLTESVNVLGDRGDLRTAQAQRDVAAIERGDFAPGAIPNPGRLAQRRLEGFDPPPRAEIAEPPRPVAETQLPRQVDEVVEPPTTLEPPTPATDPVRFDGLAGDDLLRESIRTGNRLSPEQLADVPMSPDKMRYSLRSMDEVPDLPRADDIAPEPVARSVTEDPDGGSVTSQLRNALGILDDESGIARRQVITPLAASLVGGTLFGATAQRDGDARNRAVLGASLGAMLVMSPSGFRYIDAKTGRRLSQRLAFGGKVASEAKRAGGREAAEEVMRFQEQMEGFINAANSSVKANSSDLEAALARNYGDKSGGRIAAGRVSRAVGVSDGDPLSVAPEPVKRSVARYMSGETSSDVLLSEVPLDVATPVIAARAQSDAMSEESIKRGLFEGRMRLAVEGNIGSYLVRAYRAFNTPDWAGKIEKELGSEYTGVVNRFKDWYRSAIEVSDEEVFGSAFGKAQSMALKEGVNADLGVFARGFREWWKESGSGTLNVDMVDDLIDALPEGIVDNEGLKRKLRLWYGDAFDRANPTDGTLEDGFQAFVSMGAESNSLKQLGSSNRIAASIMEKLNRNLPPQVRQVLGEIESPWERYVLSVAKQSTSLAAMRSLQGIRRVAVESGMAWDPASGVPRPDGPLELIAAADNIPLRPLEGLRASPEVARAFQEQFGTDVTSAAGNLVGAALGGLSGMSKITKVVFNQVAQLRNLISRNFIVMRAGHFATVFGPRAAASATVGAGVGAIAAGEGDRLRGATLGAASGGSAGTILAKQSMKQFLAGTGIIRGSVLDRSTFRKLQADGIVSNNADPKELESAMQNLASVKLPDFLQAKIPKRALRAMWKPVFFAYQAGDDIGKLTMYGLERDAYEQAYRSAGDAFTDEEVHQKAVTAVLAQDTSYSRVPKAIKDLGKWGGFVSFTSEVIRTAQSSVRLIADDLADPRTKAMAYRRIAGSVAAYSMAPAMGMATAQMFNVPEKTRDALRVLAAPWSRNAPLAYAPTVDGKTQYVDLSYVDPNAYFHRVAIAAMRGTPARQAAADVAFEILSPFVGGTPFINTMVEQFREQKNSTVPEAAIETLWLGMAPAFIEQVERFVTEQTERGHPTDRNTEALNAVTGIRTSTIDFRKSVLFAGVAFGRDIDAISGERRDRERETRPSSRIRQTAHDVFNLGGLSQREQMAWSRVMEVAIAARQVGLSKADIRREFRKAKVSRKMVAVIMQVVPSVIDTPGVK